MSLEEGQRLLSDRELDEESEEDEVLFASFVSSNDVLPSSSVGRASPPPSYSSPKVATLVVTDNSGHVGSRLPEPLVLGGMGPISLNEAPPDYTLHAPKGDSSHVNKAGMAVHIQIDGKLVPGTVMEDVQVSVAEQFGRERMHGSEGICIFYSAQYDADKPMALVVKMPRQPLNLDNGSGKLNPYDLLSLSQSPHRYLDGRPLQTSGRHMVYICQPQAPTSTTSECMGMSPKPKDYIFLSLISLICCLPLGVFALFKSLEVHHLYKRADYVGAARASRQAHSWGSAAVVFGTAITVVVFSLKVYFSKGYENSYYYYQ